MNAEWLLLCRRLTASMVPSKLLCDIREEERVAGWLTDLDRHLLLLLARGRLSTKEKQRIPYLQSAFYQLLVITDPARLD